jgi:bifunctional DNA-binding transcriptional regulator/antitoxin component of YhaV-PrlF toxin-antitoxin module
MGHSRRPSQFVAVAGSRGSITLPADVRRRYHLDEPGAQVEVIGREDGVIELHPVLPHSAEQAWFWTERWQAMEREAEADIASGRTETFASPEEFIADLDREADERGLR